MPKKPEITKGDRWASKTSSRGFVVESADAKEIVVKVDRVIPSKGSPSKTESRLRTVPRSEFAVFALGYQKEKS